MKNQSLKRFAIYSQSQLDSEKPKAYSKFATMQQADKFLKRLDLKSAINRECYSIVKLPE